MRQNTQCSKSDAVNGGCPCNFGQACMSTETTIKLHNALKSKVAMHVQRRCLTTLLCCFIFGGMCCYI